jgi:hypothetical protein
MNSCRSLVLGVAVAACLALVPSSNAAEVAGQTTLTYTSRSAAGNADASSRRDQDLDFWARAEARSLYGGKADGRLTFRAFKDIDGTVAGDPLSQVGDSYSHRGAVQLYEGYFSLHAPAGLQANVSLGRQYVPIGAGYAASFDGATARGRFLDNSVRVVLFGGQRVSHYREPDTKAILGGSLSTTPWNGGAIELSDLKYTRHLWEAALAQRFPGDQAAGAHVAFVGGDPESVRLSANLRLPAAFFVDAGYLRTMGKGTGSKEFPFDFTSLDDASSSRLQLGLPAPYARYRVNVRKRLNANLALSGGATRRKLIHTEDEDENNRSDWEGEGTADVRDFPVAGLTAFLRYRHVWEDRQKTPNGNSSVLTAGASYAATRTITVGAELFANGEKRSVNETLLPEGVSIIDRKERGEAAWATWAMKKLTAGVRYERTRDDLYVSYGAKNIQSIALTVTAGLEGGTPWRSR